MIICFFTKDEQVIVLGVSLLRIVAISEPMYAALNLPSSLTTLLPSACGFSPHLPVSVYGTGTYHTIAAFLDSVDSETSLLLFSPHRTSSSRDGFAYLP